VEVLQKDGAPAVLTLSEKKDSVAEFIGLQKLVQFYHVHSLKVRRN
jgi:hypothetical protein